MMLDRDRGKVAVAMSLFEWARANNIKPPFAAGTAERYAQYRRLFDAADA